MSAQSNDERTTHVTSHHTIKSMSADPCEDVSSGARNRWQKCILSVPEKLLSRVSVKLSSCPHCKCRRPSSSPHLLTVRSNYAFCCCLKGRSRECDRSSSKPNALEWPETSRKGMATDFYGRHLFTFTKTNLLRCALFTCPPLSAMSLFLPV